MMGKMGTKSALLVGPMHDALRACRQHLVAAAAFSALVNLLYIAPTLYMLQVYDRVVPTQGLNTLAFLTAVLLFALGTLALLDRLRTQLLVRAGVQLDSVLAHRILDATIGRADIAEARQAIREFDGLRAVLTGPGMMALLDAPWMPIYIIVCTIVHPWIGALALFGCIVLPLVAWLSDRATRERLNRAQQVAVQSYAQQENVIDNAEVVARAGHASRARAAPDAPAQGDAGRPDRGGLLGGALPHILQVPAPGAAVAGAGARRLAGGRAAGRARRDLRLLLPDCPRTGPRSSSSSPICAISARPGGAGAISTYCSRPCRSNRT